MQHSRQCRVKVGGTPLIATCAQSRTTGTGARHHQSLESPTDSISVVFNSVQFQVTALGPTWGGGVVVKNGRCRLGASSNAAIMLRQPSTPKSRQSWSDESRAEPHADADPARGKRWDKAKRQHFAQILVAVSVRKTKLKAARTIDRLITINIGAFHTLREDTD